MTAVTLGPPGERTDVPIRPRKGIPINGQPLE